MATNDLLVDKNTIEDARHQDLQKLNKIIRCITVVFKTLDGADYDWVTSDVPDPYNEEADK